MPFKVVYLKGEYAGPYDRQRQALQNKTDLVLELHFNSSDSIRAKGAEIYYYEPPNTKFSVKELATKLISAITDVTKEPKRKIVDVYKELAPRAFFIAKYHCPALLLEPLFVSNPTSAETFLHNTDNFRKLATAIANTVVSFLKEIDAEKTWVIGLSAGHNFRGVARKNDKGAPCAAEEGCSEAVHTLQLAHALASIFKLKNGG